MFDWDDLRHFLAVARTGTTLGAARALGTSQPTVVRRIAAFEAGAGTALFERRRTGYTLTAAGREILPLVERVEAETSAVADGLAAHCRRLAGTIRVTAAESIANMLLAPAIGAFRRTHPSVQVQLMIEDRYLDLARGEADIAVRASTHGLESSDLVAHLLSESPWAVYCSRTYAAQAGLPGDAAALAGHAIVSGEGALGAFPALAWLESAAAGAHVVCRSTTLTSLHAAVSAGLGVSALPCMLGGNDPLLVKCFGLTQLRNAEIWLVSRAEVRRLPHVRAFIAALTAHFRAARSVIYGEAGGIGAAAPPAAVPPG